MSNRGGLRLGFGGKRTKRAAKKSEGTHLTPRKDEPLTVRCAKSLAEALSEQSDDVEEWGAVVCSWPAAALERVLPLLPRACPGDCTRPSAASRRRRTTC